MPPDDGSQLETISRRLYEFFRLRGPSIARKQVGRTQLNFATGNLIPCDRKRVRQDRQRSMQRKVAQTLQERYLGIR